MNSPRGKIDESRQNCEFEKAGNLGHKRSYLGKGAINGITLNPENQH
jgi:hypothetical protein